MSHFAKLDENNVVIFVTVGRQEDDGKEEELSARTGERYKQTSYNTHGGVHYDPTTGQPSADQSKTFRKNYAALGFIYNEEIDGFIPPKPFASWVLDEQTGFWEPPVQKPLDGFQYAWDEENLQWIRHE
jgi:hypothetical protein